MRDTCLRAKSPIIWPWPAARSKLLHQYLQQKVLVRPLLASLHPCPSLSFCSSVKIEIRKNSLMRYVVNEINGIFFFFPKLFISFYIEVTVFGLYTAFQLHRNICSCLAFGVHTVVDLCVLKT